MKGVVNSNGEIQLCVIKCTNISDQIHFKNIGLPARKEKKVYQEEDLNLEIILAFYFFSGNLR